MNEYICNIFTLVTRGLFNVSENYTETIKPIFHGYHYFDKVKEFTIF